MAVTINGTTGILAPDIGIDGTTLTVDAVNNRVGIGTTTPFGTLQVRPGTNANFSFSTGAGESSLEILNDAGSANVPLNVRASEYKIKIQGTEKLHIDSSGRVLIGLTTSQTTDSNAHSKLQIATSAGPNIALGNNSTDINNDGRLGVINFNSNHGGTYHEVATIASRADADHASNSKASRLEFYTTPAGNTQGIERLRIKSDAKFGFNTIIPPRDYCFHSGQTDTNIQITNNTTGVDDSAGALIQQDGNDLYIWNKENSFMSLGTNATEKLRITSGGVLQVAAGGNLQMASNGRIFVGNGGNATDPMFANVSDTNTGIAFPAADTMMFTTGGTERLRIHDGGEFTVGTTSVIGRYTFYNAGSSGNDATGGDKGMYLRSDMGPTHVDLTGVDNYTMQISNSAFSGTGIANPQGTITKLLFHGCTYNGWNSYAAICMDNQGASGYRGDFVFIAGGSERLRIKSDGKVSIGAALPSSGSGTFNVKPASATDSYFKLRPASEFDGAITGTAIDIRNSSNGASHHLVLRAQEFRFWCDDADKVRITSDGHYTSGNLTISGRANYGTIGGYAQVLSDNHGNTFFGQNIKVGTGNNNNGDHTLRIINQHASIGGAGMFIGGNGSGRQNTINFYAESANQVPTTDVTANAKMTLNTSGQLTTMGEQRIRYHTGSTDSKTSKITTALGKSGTYSTCTVTIESHSYGSMAYDIAVGGYSAAHCHRVGTYYINGNIYGSYTSISNVGGSVSASGPNYVNTQKAQWTFSKSNGFVHPICSVTAAFGGDGYLNHGDISIVWS